MHAGRCRQSHPCQPHAAARGLSRPGDREERRADRLARAAGRDPVPAALTPLAGGGPLPAPLRAHFGPRFGHDFSRVRVHADGEAAAAARDLGARAFTVGQDVYFAAGEYRPETPGGRRLLAHELAHVVQGGTAIRRQVEEDAPPPQVHFPPEGGPEASGRDFRRCTPDQDAAIARRIRIGWYAVANAERELDAALTFPLDPARHRETVEEELQSVFHTLDRRHLRTIRARLAFVKAIMGKRREWNWVCGTEAQCKGDKEGIPYASAGPETPVMICPPFFPRDDIHGAQILVHESAHQAGLMRNKGGRDSSLTAQQTLDNADSYAVFVMQTLFGPLAHESEMGATTYRRGMEIWVAGEYIVFDSARSIPPDPGALVGNELALVMRYFHGTSAPALPAPDTVLSLRVTLEREDATRGSLPAKEVLFDRTDDAPEAGVGGYAGRLLSTIPDHLSQPMTPADKGQLRIEASIRDPSGTVLDAADLRVPVTGRYEPSGP